VAEQFLALDILTANIFSAFDRFFVCHDEMDGMDYDWEESTELRTSKW